VLCAHSEGVNPYGLDCGPHLGNCRLQVRPSICKSQTWMSKSRIGTAQSTVAVAKPIVVTTNAKPQRSDVWTRAARLQTSTTNPQTSTTNL